MNKLWENYLDANRGHFLLKDQTNKPKKKKKKKKKKQKNKVGLSP